MNMKNNLMLACGTTLLIMGCSSAYDKSDESHNIQVPAVKFDLSQWNITVPLDVNNDKKVDTISVKDIQQYQHPDYFFLDSDGDGYGDDTVMILGCELPAGYSEIDGDCDDSEASIYPDAPGSQEGLDNNCNGVIDPQEDPCFGDLNDDFSVDVSDLLILLNWAGCANNDCGADLNNDDSTTMADLLLFISFFGFQCD